MYKYTRTIDVRNAIMDARSQGRTVGYVPTMGYLHVGHRSLIERARSECDYVVVSVFVNPTQFGVGEDLDRYPRDLDADSQMCESSGVDVLFHPEVSEIYPEHPFDALVVSYPELSTKLCGAFRPGHFDGVTTVMSKLLNIVSPNKCYMGKKDGQQLLIVKRLVADSFFDVDIVGCSTVRESDGLALSSRNAYLSADERTVAAELNKSLEKVARVIESGNPEIDVAISRAREELTRGGLVVQYCDLVDADTLEPARELSPGEYLLGVAALCGTTRLIDNYSVAVTQQGEFEIDRGITGQVSEKSHV